MQESANKLGGSSFPAVILKTILEGLHTDECGVINVTPWEGTLETACLNSNLTQADSKMPKLRCMTLCSDDNVIMFAQRAVGLHLMKANGREYQAVSTPVQAQCNATCRCQREHTQSTADILAHALLPYAAANMSELHMLHDTEAGGWMRRLAAAAGRSWARRKAACAARRRAWLRIADGHAGGPPVRPEGVLRPRHRQAR